MRKLTHGEISAKRIPQSDAARVPRLPIYALADNVRSLYNVGSMFRTADGALIEKLILTGFTPHPPRKEIDKTALGATETVPWEYTADPVAAVRALKNRGVSICAVELTSSSRPYSSLTKADFPLCLVFGNEITGISKEVIDEADMALEIPMLGTKQSLNVAVAFGIVLFECARVIGGGAIHRRE